MGIIISALKIIFIRYNVAQQITAPIAPHFGNEPNPDGEAIEHQIGVLNAAYQSCYSDFDKLHYNVRENQLDTMFLMRKKKLLDICKENKLIFEKIYTQRSAYPKEQFDESYETNRIISDRILKGKLRDRKAFAGEDKDTNDTGNTRCASQRTWRTLEKDNTRVLPTL